MSSDRQASDQSAKYSPTAAHALGETEFRTLANVLPHIIWECDAGGQLAWVNERWTELTGLSDTETLSDKGALVAVHEEDRPALARTWNDILLSGAAGEVEYRIRTKDGTYRWHVARIAPIRDADGRLTRWIAATFDIHDHRAAEEALLASEHRFKAVFDLSPQATAITRLSDGVYLAVNEAFIRLTGYPREEIVGKSTVSLGIWTEEQRAEFITATQDLARDGAELSFRARDGRMLAVMVSSARIDLDGEACLVNVATDVTARRAAEAAMRSNEVEAQARADELFALMDAVPAAVFISQDAECRSVQGNRAAHALMRMGMDANLSKSSPDRAGTQYFTISADGLALADDELPLQRASRGEDIPHNEHKIRFGDGSEIWLLGGAVPLRELDGTPRGAIGAFVNVTQLKEAEAALRLADQRKDEFLALLSHELRNPLSPILTSAQLLKRRNDPEAEYDLDVIIRQVKHLVRLVDDLLDVSRVKRGRVSLNKTRLELATAVSRAVEATQPLIDERRHSLTMSVPPEGLEIEADEVRITQVITNLLTNAAHYTPRGGSIVITATRDEEPGKEIVLSVRDTGVGIDATLLPDVFETFVQGARGADRSKGGLGLGLSLVRTLTELHGGTVRAFSEGPDRGSEFVVRLPAATASAGFRSPSAPVVVRPREVRARSTRVLAVDDNLDVLNGAARVLTQAGYQVRTASDPLTAIALAEEFRPHIAILDIGLPVMDGYELGRELVTRQNDAPPVLIALSGYSESHSTQREDHSAFSMHLVKPVDAEELVQLLDSIVAEPG